MQLHWYTGLIYATKKLKSFWETHDCLLLLLIRGKNTFHSERALNFCELLDGL